MKIFNISLWSSVHSVQSTKPKAWKSHVYIEWFVILFVAALSLVGIALWSSYMYGGILNRLSAENALQQQDLALSVDKDSLTATLMLFEQKKERYDALGISRPAYSDPSR